MNETISSILAKDEKYIWHPYTQQKTAAKPLSIVSGKGAYLIDEEGNEFLDAVASWWVNLHGHAHPYIAQKVYEQMMELEHVIFAGFTHKPATDLAEKLIQILPSKQARVFYSDNGSTAVEIGIKMAIQYFHNQEKPRRYLVGFNNAFHGETFGAMSASGDLSLNNAYKEHLFEVKRIPEPTKGQEKAALEALEELLKTGEIYAFIFEPLVMGAGGMMMYEPEILSELIALCHRYDTLCIADEVMTGFGRTGKLFACDYLTEQPDIMCLSKGISGGTLPLAVTTCTANIFDAFLSDDKYKTFFHGHSYTANPVGCAAGLASMDLLLSEECIAQRKMIETEHAAFKKSLEGHPSFREVRQRGTIIALEFETGNASTNYFNDLRDKMYYFFLENGVLLRPLGNVIYIMPPYCMEREDLRKIYKLIMQFVENEL